MGEYGDAIVNASNEHGCDLIVMTMRRRKGELVLVFRGIMSADHPDRGQAARKEAVKTGSAAYLPQSR